MLTKKFFAGLLAPLVLSGSLVSPAAADEGADEPEKNLIEVAAEAGDFTMFLRVLEETELREKLEEEEGPFTVFAPSDDAFDLMSMDLIDLLLHPRQEHYRTRLLGNHIVEGEVRSEDNLGEGEQEVETLAGTTLSYVSEPGHFYLETARIQDPDMEASNGVLHRINRIIVLQY